MFGREEFFKKELIDHFIVRILGSALQVDSISRLTPQNTRELGEAILDLRTDSFFSTKRFCILSDCDELASDAAPELIEALENGLHCGHLILNLRKLSLSSKLGTAAFNHKAAINCRKLYDTPPPWKQTTAPLETELNFWTVQHAQKMNIHLPLDLAGEITGLTGNNPGAIHQELTKLRERMGSQTSAPTSAQIRSLVPDNRRDSVFVLLDAALRGDTKKAYASLTRLFEFGYELKDEIISEPQTIALLTIGAFTRQLAVLRRCRFFSSQRRSLPDLAASGFIRKVQIPSLSTQLRLLSSRDIDHGVQIVLEADRSLKGKFGTLPPQRILERMILRLLKLSASPVPARN